MARRKRARRRSGFRARARAVGSRIRRSVRRRRSTQMGILGKTGAAVAAGAPVGFAAIDAGRGFFYQPNDVSGSPIPLNIFDKLAMAALSAVNSLGVGFGLGQPYPNYQPIALVQTGRVISPIALPTPTPPQGSHWIAETVGIGAVLVDAITGRLVGFAKGSKGSVRMGGIALTSGRR